MRSGNSGVAVETTKVVRDGVADGTKIVAGPFQTLRDLRDGMSVRVR